MTHDLCQTGNKSREEWIKWGNIIGHSGKTQRCKRRSFVFCFVFENDLTIFSNSSNSFETESWWNSNTVWQKIIWKPYQSRIEKTKMRKEKRRIKIWNRYGYKAGGWLWELQMERRVLVLLFSPMSKPLGLVYF